MKKLFFVVAVVFITIGLSGCDLISPSIVEEISEEYCRENPTAEICQGDAVGDLENDVILNVFNTILDEYNDAANETFCDDYFSVTNIELLDSCRAARADLVPADYVGYTVTDISKKPTLSTQNVYEITVVSEDMKTEIIFTVGVVNVEGIMYINSWSFDVNDDGPQVLGVPFDDAKAYFDQFISDYLNTAIDSYDFCNMYFKEDVTGCIEERDKSFAEGFKVTLDGMYDTGEGIYEVKMFFTNFNSTEPKAEVENISFTYDLDGNIIMKFMDEYQTKEWLNAEEAFTVIQMFLTDFADSTITDEQLTHLYFDNNIDPGFFNDRYKSQNGDAVLTVISVEEPTEEPFDFLKVTMSRTYDGETETMVVPIRIKDLGDGRYYFDILFEDHRDYDYDTLKQFTIDMLRDYQDTTLTDEYVCNLYFEHDAAKGCMDDRANQLTQGVTIVLNNLTNVYDYYEIEFGFDDGTDVWQEYVYAIYYYNEFDELKIEFSDLGFDEIDYYDAYYFMENLFGQYRNSSLISYDVCSQFFEGPSYDECVIRRQQEMMDGIYLNGFNLYHDGYGFTVEYHYNDTYGNSFSKSMQAYFYYNEYGELRLEFFEDFSLIPYEEAWPFIEQMVNDFNNWTIDTEYMCNYYFSYESAQGCIEQRNKSIANNVQVRISMFEPEFDHYRVELEYNDGQGHTWYETFHAYFWYDESNNMKIDFKGERPDDFPYNEAYDYFQILLDDYTNPTVTGHDFCNKYFPWLPGDNCLWDRAVLYPMLEHVDAHIDYMDYHDYVFQAQVTFTNHYTGLMWTEIVYLEFYYNEYGDIEMHLYDAPVNQYLSHYDSSEVINSFFFDYSNSNISYDELNAWYFDYTLDYDFELDRIDAFNAGRYFNILYINDPHNADGQEFLEVVFDVFEGTNNVDTMTMWMRVMPLGTGYHYIEVKEEYHPDFVDIDESEAHAYMQQFVDEYSNYLLTSYDVCSRWFDAYEYPMCIVKREQEMMDGIHINLYDFYKDEISGDFYANLEYFNNVGEFIYSENTQVFFFYGEQGELKISFESYNYNKSFPYDEAMQYINTMFADYNDPGMPNGVFCGYYGHIFPQCDVIRQSYLDGVANIYFSNFWHDYENVFYLEYAYQANDGDTTNYIGIELAFFYDEFGNIVVDVWNNFPYFHYENYAHSQVIYNNFLADYLNPAVSTQAILDKYFDGWLDEEFINQRGEDLVNGITITTPVFTDTNLGDGIDWINVTFEVDRGDGWIEYVDDNFRVIVRGHLLYQLEFESFYHEEVTYPDAFDLFSAYIRDLQDSTITSPDFCEIYHDEYLYEHCEMMRNDLLVIGYNIEIIDFYFDDYMYVYQATLMYTDPVTLMDEYYDYDIMFWVNADGVLKLEIYDRYFTYDPMFDQLWNIMSQFESDFADSTMSSLDFCDKYYGGDAVCIVTRDEYFARGLVDGGVRLEDFYWYQDYDGIIIYEAQISYTFSDGSFVRNRLEVVPYYDIDGFLMVELLITGGQVSVPENATLLILSETISTLTSFAIDYSDSSITSQDFCEKYFDGIPNCMEERDKFLAMGGSAVLNTDIYQMSDYNNVPFYMATFTMTDETGTWSQEGAFRVWDLTNDRYFIEFVDDYNLPVDPVELFVLTIGNAENLYRNFLSDYADLSISNMDICGMYFNDTSFDCVAGREAFLNNGGFTTLLSITEIDVVDGDNYFRVVLEQYNGNEYLYFAQDFYAYGTPDGYEFMIIIVD